MTFFFSCFYSFNHFHMRMSNTSMNLFFFYHLLFDHMFSSHCKGSLLAVSHDRSYHAKESMFAEVLLPVSTMCMQREERKTGSNLKQMSFWNPWLLIQLISGTPQRNFFMWSKIPPIPLSSDNPTSSLLWLCVTFCRHYIFVSCYQTVSVDPIVWLQPLIIYGLTHNIQRCDFIL